MSTNEAEVPLETAHTPELGPLGARKSREPRFVVLYLLGVAMLASIGGWIAMVLMDKEVPDGFPVVIGTVIGGLVGIAASDRSA
ncbi:hypothetical protein [Frankia nepalensis]|uniref:hypothetical protein n=1 Tax=Frankia nepalensis TaxID=1836974 RepID=UPI001EE3E440|nr:hypothetical protein [Frankia nepalensis]